VQALIIVGGDGSLGDWRNNCRNLASTASAYRRRSTTISKRRRSRSVSILPLMSWWMRWIDCTLRRRAIGGSLSSK